MVSPFVYLMVLLYQNTRFWQPSTMVLKQPVVLLLDILQSQ
jgi:hypothetical protein